jgi:hypothetical protein
MINPCIHRKVKKILLLLSCPIHRKYLVRLETAGRFYWSKIEEIQLSRLKNNFGLNSTDLDGVLLCSTEIDGFLPKRIESPTPEILVRQFNWIFYQANATWTHLIHNELLFWKMNLDFRAHTRVIADISTLSLGIKPSAAGLLIFTFKDFKWLKNMIWAIKKFPSVTCRCRCRTQNLHFTYRHGLKC